MFTTDQTLIKSVNDPNDQKAPIADMVAIEGGEGVEFASWNSFRDN